MNLLNLIKSNHGPDDVHLLVQTGSVAYGCSKSNSDMDVYGFCIPKLENIFPILNGEIPGFGRQIQRFEQFQKHKVIEQENEYDFTIFSIVKYFSLLMDNNPNVLDSLFVPEDCVLYQSKIGELLRKNRKLFLHKGSYHRFLGYSFSQQHKMSIKIPPENSKRYEDYKKHGFCLKFSTHLVRLLFEGIQILEEGDIDLRKHSDILRDIRGGKWTLPMVNDFFEEKKLLMKKLYDESNLIPHSPDEDKIRELLLECLEMRYGKLKLNRIQAILEE